MPCKHYPKESQFCYANANVNPRESVAGHNGWYRPKEGMGFIQHMVATYLPWNREERQLSEAGISGIREMSWGDILK